ncbi:3beta,22alpha-dihydroxysteroid 3-dehydrogenase isoform X2 [Cryptomeria japonica]|uniref:3beta,22alpha-dihydroxysteroid 3-dehydrogenase isoform X2 n=1 Tax=Cryptomeria japonica TaxID=3369 RepID=UPI0025AC2D3F|nr:3beta,22alpha-dihydroxysteroid 3-dehydrogenase isoform X2 [Cryptomeria japonica]
MAIALLAVLNTLTVQQWQWIILAMAMAIIALFISHFTFAFSLHGNNGEPPGSRGCPFLGETFAFIAANKSSKGVYEFVHQRHLRFGRAFKTRIFGKTHVFMPGPEVAKLVLSGEFSEFTKSYIKSMHDAVGQHSLLCVKQQTHVKLRRLLGELFTVEALAKSLQHIDNLITHSLTQWKDLSSIRVIGYTLDITFKIMCGMLLSVEGDEEINKIRKDVDDVSDAMLSLPIKLPGTRYYRGIKARRRFMKFLDVLIERRRNREEHHDDFLQSMLSRDERLTDVELKDNILTLILAGQTTTAAAMMWAVKYIDQNPQVQFKLRAEQEIVRQRYSDHLKLEDVNGMIYTSKVVKEVLRMASIVSWMPRLALNDCNVLDKEGVGFEHRCSLYAF